jgi:alanine racemase
LLEEALELRGAGIEQPILLLQGVTTKAELALAAQERFIVMLHNEEQLRLVVESRSHEPVSVWLKIDTGMHRLGLPPGQCKQAMAMLKDSGRCNQALVVCTHLACADELDNATTQDQIEVFDDCVAGLDAALSISNSAGILAWPASHRQWNRPGYMLFGYSPIRDEKAAGGELKPAMTLSSTVIGVRDIDRGETVGYGGRWQAGAPAKIATVAIGYADGYPRHAPNGTPVLVNGREATLVGAVSMDMITVDVSGHPEVHVGDPVRLWGPDLSVDRIADAAGTTGYELLTRVSSRVQRVYTD